MDGVALFQEQACAALGSVARAPLKGGSRSTVWKVDKGRCPGVLKLHLFANGAEGARKLALEMKQLQALARLKLPLDFPEVWGSFQNEIGFAFLESFCLGQNLSTLLARNPRRLPGVLRPLFATWNEASIPMPSGFFATHFIERPLARLHELAGRGTANTWADLFRGCLAAPALCVNGEKIEAPLAGFEAWGHGLAQEATTLSLCVSGDLIPENALVSPEGRLVLLDPRGHCHYHEAAGVPLPFFLPEFDLAKLTFCFLGWRAIADHDFTLGMGERGEFHLQLGAPGHAPLLEQVLQSISGLMREFGWGPERAMQIAFLVAGNFMADTASRVQEETPEAYRQATALLLMGALVCARARRGAAPHPLGMLGGLAAELRRAS